LPIADQWAELSVQFIQHGPAFGSQSILLFAASWLVRDGHFNESGFQGRLQVTFPEVCLAFELEFCLQVRSVLRLCQGLEKLFNFYCNFY